MDAEHHQLHIILFPFPAPGHMIPLIDIARLLATRNVKTTILTTHANASLFTKAIETNHKPGNINLKIFKFPTQEAGLPEGCDDAETAIKLGLSHKFLMSTHFLSEQLEQYLDKVRPDCLVADMFYPWTSETAAKVDVPRVVFHGISYFSLCAEELIRVYEPFKNLTSDDERFSIPLIPHEIKLFRSQIHPDFISNKDDTFRKKFDFQMKKSEDESYGVIVNSFYELEPDYAEFFKKETGRKAWHVGPVSLCNRSIEQKAQRRKQGSINERDCLNWLDTKNHASVVYICFGSITHSLAPQLHEIAVALESSGNNFIWVVQKDENNNEEWIRAKDTRERSHNKRMGPAGADT